MAAVVVHALLRAASTLLSTPKFTRAGGVDRSVDTARKSACATGLVVDCDQGAGLSGAARDRLVAISERCRELQR